jgi:multidrug efflux pump
LEALAHETLPAGYGYEWTETALQELIAGNSALFVFPICVLLCSLCWRRYTKIGPSPWRSFLSFRCGILFSLTGIPSGGDNNIFPNRLRCPNGLASKNAILIVEFAKMIEERDGKTPLERARSEPSAFATDLDDVLRFYSGRDSLALASGRVTSCVARSGLPSSPECSA